MSWMLVLLATNRGRQRSVVAPRTFCEVGAFILSAWNTHTRTRTHSQVFQRSYVFIELRFITVRFDEGLTPRQVSVSKQAEGEERRPGKDFLSIW